MEVLESKIGATSDTEGERERRRTMKKEKKRKEMDMNKPHRYEDIMEYPLYN